MIPPTVDDVKSWSRVDFSGLDDPFTDDDLAVVVPRAVAYVEQVTGRTIDDSFPPPLETMGQEAIQMRVEQVAYQSQTDYTETAADDLVQTFSAGGYSETRHELTSRARGNPIGYPAVNPWVALNQRLWLLMTPDQQDYWRMILQGSPIPGVEVTEVDWNNYDGLYPTSERGGAGADPFIWGA